MSKSFSPSSSPGRSKVNSVPYTTTQFAGRGFYSLGSYYYVCNYDMIHLLTPVMPSGKILYPWTAENAINRSLLNFGFFFRNSNDVLAVVASDILQSV